MMMKLKIELTTVVCFQVIMINVVDDHENYGEDEDWIVHIANGNTRHYELSKKSYDFIVLEPGPHLNLIIGPNGTGKSAIMCAMCLGLGGHPKTVGRAQNSSPQEYIKYGEDKATIEIHINDGERGECIIKRVICRSTKTTVFTINDHKASPNEVNQLVAGMHIQVNNLCQFLPQEKVSDFAKMTPEELLENTEKAVGEDEMQEAHQRLKDARKTALQLDHNYRSLNDRLSESKKQNERMIQDVKNFEERQANLKVIDNVKMKIPWVSYSIKRMEHLKMKATATEKERELAEFQKQLAPMRGEKEELEKGLKRLMEDKTTQEARLNELIAKARAFLEEINKESDRISEIEDDFKVKLNQEQSRKKCILDMEQQRTALEEELSSFSADDVQPEMDRIKRGMHDVTHQLTQIQTNGQKLQMEVSAYEREISDKVNDEAELRNTRNARLVALRQRHKHTYDAVMWLRDNTHQFTDTIHEPMFLTLNVVDARFAKYVENHIPFNDMRAFICENGDDAELFIKTVKSQLGLQVNVLIAPPQDSFHPVIPLSRLSKYGFHHYMREVIVCHPAIMRYNCLLHSVHDIPIGDSTTNSCIESILRECPSLRRFYTDNTQFNVKKSRYTNETSTRSMHIPEASNLNISVDVQKLQQIESDLKQLRSHKEAKVNKYNSLKEHSKELESKLNVLRDEKRDLSKAKEKRGALKARIQSIQDRIRRKNADELNIQAETEKKMRHIGEIMARKAGHLRKHNDTYKIVVELGRNNVLLSLRYCDVTEELRQLEKRSQQQIQACRDLEVEVEELQKMVVTSRADAKFLYEKASEAMGKLTTEKKQTMQQYPDSIEELEALIREHQIKADLAFQTDSSKIKEYYEREKNIEKMERELAKSQATMKKHQTDMQAARQAWLGPLHDLISRINDTFSVFFSYMKCAGEVALNVPEDQEDYGKYGIKIRVKFRDSEMLTELNAQTQSGGERSVATVMYMMSLQEVTVCPFRCVDEINQGMDPTNERKVMEVIFKTVCERNSSQYFLLTPKLLTGLVYPKNHNIISIFNGEDEHLTSL